MRTQPEHMVVGFRGCTLVLAAKRTGEQLLPGGCRTRFLTVIVIYGSVPFMEKFCIVTAGVLRTSKTLEAKPMVASSHLEGSERRERLRSRAFWAWRRRSDWIRASRVVRVGAPEKRSRQVEVFPSRSTERHSESARLLSRVENSEEGRSEGEMPVRE